MSGFGGGFGATPPQQGNPFGSQPPSGFGTASTQPPTFGGSAPFGTAAPNPFAVSTSTTPFQAAPPASFTPAASSGFGQPSAPPGGSGMMFGTSPNLAPPTQQQQQQPSFTAPSFGQSQTTAFPSGTTSIGSAPSFPPASSFSQPFGGGSQNPFGASAAPMSFAASSNVTTMPDPMMTPPIHQDDDKKSNSLPFGVIPQQKEKQQDSDTTTPFDQQQDKLARLKAKLEAKKRALSEKKKKSTDGLNPNAAAFEPRSTSTDGQTSPMTLAQRNAIRFSNNSNNSSASTQLPADLKSTQTTDYASLRVEKGRDDREDLETAVSLVGTCPHMCPDEELLRRQRENDLSLLELPHSKLHPPHWTLRDTAVKRFRRSAADYKLDVPEWVRPPDVLERVCGFLEEWVMVCVVMIDTDSCAVVSLYKLTRVE